MEVNPISAAVVPFAFEIPEADLAELRAYLQHLCRYWAEEYDWRAVESRLNALSQLRTEIDGLELCFIHVRSRHEGVYR